MTSYKKGKLAENKALNYLTSKEYKIIETNYQTKIGEIDIICLSKKNILVFIEVKSVSNNYIHPIEKITKRKINKIINTSNTFISMYNYNNYQIQYDFIGIIKSNIIHYENIIQI